MKKQNNRRAAGTVALLAIAVSAAVGGCTYLKQAREDVKPQAVPAMHAAQTLNPDASKNRKVVAGLDGNAAASTVKSYDKTFEANRSTSAKEAYQGGTAAGGN